MGSRCKRSARSLGSPRVSTAYDERFAISLAALDSLIGPRQSNHGPIMTVGHPMAIGLGPPGISTTMSFTRHAI